MSNRGDGRALDAAARAQWERFAELEGRPEWGPDSQESTTRALWENLLESTEVGIDSYLSALLSELPEEAVLAAATEIAHAEVPEHYPATPEEMAPHYVDSAVLQITAFVLSLRSSSRGANG